MAGLTTIPSWLSACAGRGTHTRSKKNKEQAPLGDNKDKRLALPDSPAKVEVFMIAETTTKETWKQMDYEDHTVRSPHTRVLIRLDFHAKNATPDTLFLARYSRLW